jgi:hypothetical protein
MKTYKVDLYITGHEHRYILNLKSRASFISQFAATHVSGPFLTALWARNPTLTPQILVNICTFSLLITFKFYAIKIFFQSIWWWEALVVMKWTTKHRLPTFFKILPLLFLFVWLFDTDGLAKIYKLSLMLRFRRMRTGLHLRTTNT